MGLITAILISFVVSIVLYNLNNNRKKSFGIRSIIIQDLKKFYKKNLTKK